MNAARIIASLALCLPSVHTPAAQPLDPGLVERIDRFVAAEAGSSGLPGVAIAVLQDGRAPHVRGFGHDGRGKPISGDTPFPIGLLTKSFTAMLVRQAIEAGQLDADAPVQRYLPWFRVADAEASSRITLRHLLNQTSGLPRADGIAPRFITGLTPALLAAFAPDLSLVWAAATTLLCSPLAWRIGRSMLRHSAS